MIMKATRISSASIINNETKVTLLPIMLCGSIKMRSLRVKQAFHLFEKIRYEGIALNSIG